MFNPYRPDSSSDEDRSDLEYHGPAFHSLGKEKFHFKGLSLCCYAPLLPHAGHFTCSDCSTLFNTVRS
jgi:hypothetical protein